MSGQNALEPVLSSFIIQNMVKIHILAELKCLKCVAVAVYSPEITVFDLCFMLDPPAEFVAEAFRS